MPRKNKDKYQNYDKINQYFALNAILSNLGEIGHSLVDGWERWSGDVLNATAADLEVRPEEEILYRIGNTNQYFRTAGNNLLSRGKRLASDLETKVRDYNGPFKEILESVSYIFNPGNGNMLDLCVDQPALNRIFIGSCAGMPCTTLTNTRKGKPYTMDTALNEERRQALGELYPLFTDFFKKEKDFAKVLFERQKAEKDKKTGLDTVYAKKYASAIDKMVRSYDRLKSAAEERYRRTDLTEQAKDLESIEGPVSNKEIKVLNNALFETTDAHPDKVSRNSISAAMENLRAQSKAIKAGWSIDEARIMGLLAEAKAEAAEGIKNYKLTVKRDRERIAELEKKIEESGKLDQDPAEDRKKLENEQKHLQSYEIKLSKAEQALKDSGELYGKYEKIKNPTFYQKRYALNDMQRLLEKYREKKPQDCVLRYADEGFKAAEEKITDPYDFRGKTRLQQAQAMLKTLKDVNTWGRSSDNFEELKRNVEKLVELARRFPENMSTEQFQAYERQNAEVVKKINKYTKGKKQQQSDYKAAHNGEEKPISEYTARRINAVNKLLSMALTHISIASEGHTREYTGTPHERAMALYERRIREEARKRQNMLGKGYKGPSDGQEGYDASREAASFCKSVYIEKMKERYELDPNFTAEDFCASLALPKIKAGAKTEHETMIAKNKRYRKHMGEELQRRIEMDGEEEWMENYDNQDYAIHDEIPNGVGHDWVKFELKNYRAMFDIPEPSAEDYENDSEIDESEIDKSEIDKSELDKSEIDDLKIKESEIDDFKIKESEPKKSGRKMDESIVNFIVPHDNLAGKIFDTMQTENLRKNEDPAYLSIAKDIAEHAVREKDRTNTKLPMETMMKMAKYLDEGRDIKKPTRDETTRWNIIRCAFNQYQQKDADFQKNAGGFMLEAKPGPNYDHGAGCYKGLFYEALEKSTEEAGKAYQAKPDDPKLAAAVKNKAYQVLMTDMVEATVGRAKGVAYTKFNNSLDSTDNKKYRDGFIKDLPEDFKTTYENLILDSARKGTFTLKSASDACDKALAMTMDERKKASDAKNVKNAENEKNAGNAKKANNSAKSEAERKLDDLVDVLKRNPRRIEQLREKAPGPKKSL